MQHSEWNWCKSMRFLSFIKEGCLLCAKGIPIYTSHTIPHPSFLCMKNLVYSWGLLKQGHSICVYQWTAIFWLNTILKWHMSINRMQMSLKEKNKNKTHLCLCLPDLPTSQIYFMWQAGMASYVWTTSTHTWAETVAMALAKCSHYLFSLHPLLLMTFQYHRNSLQCLSVGSRKTRRATVRLKEMKKKRAVRWKEI